MFVKQWNGNGTKPNPRKNIFNWTTAYARKRKKSKTLKDIHIESVLRRINKICKRKIKNQQDWELRGKNYFLIPTWNNIKIIHAKIVNMAKLSSLVLHISRLLDGHNKKKPSSLRFFTLILFYLPRTNLFIDVLMPMLSDVHGAQFAYFLIWSIHKITIQSHFFDSNFRKHSFFCCITSLISFLLCFYPSLQLICSSQYMFIIHTN